MPFRRHVHVTRRAYQVASAFALDTGHAMANCGFHRTMAQRGLYRAAVTSWIDEGDVDHRLQSIQ
jgi:hypothetical protein